MTGKPKSKAGKLNETGTVMISIHLQCPVKRGWNRLPGNIIRHISLPQCNVESVYDAIKKHFLRDNM